jgi:GTP-binding protein Era
MIFLDTPGIHSAANTLNLRMVDIALTSMAEADLILLMVDVTAPDSESEALLVKHIRKQQRPVILAVNKTDLVAKEAVLLALDRWHRIYPFQAIVPISAQTGEQVDVLIGEMEKLLPQGPPYFPENSITDMPERFVVAEMVREKIFRLTGQEIPYSAAVTVESFTETDDLLRIHATIHLERDSQKGIVIGKNGQKLKQIGQAARMDIEKLLGIHVFLKLFVRVQKNWTRDTKALTKFGY